MVMLQNTFKSQYLGNSTVTTLFCFIHEYEIVWFRMINSTIDCIWMTFRLIQIVALPLMYIYETLINSGCCMQTVYDISTGACGVPSCVCIRLFFREFLAYCFPSSVILLLVETSCHGLSGTFCIRIFSGSRTFSKSERVIFLDKLQYTFSIQCILCSLCTAQELCFLEANEWEL